MRLNRFAALAVSELRNLTQSVKNFDLFGRVASEQERHFVSATGFETVSRDFIARRKKTRQAGLANATYRFVNAFQNGRVAAFVKSDCRPEFAPELFDLGDLRALRVVGVLCANNPKSPQIAQIEKLW